MTMGRNVKEEVRILVLIQRSAWIDEADFRSREPRLNITYERNDRSLNADHIGLPLRKVRLISKDSYI